MFDRDSDQRRPYLEWGGFLILPVLIFPMFFGLAAALDWIAGDATVLLQLLYGKKHILLASFLQDWVASAPLSIVVWLLYVPAYLFLTRKGLNAPPAAIAAGFIVGTLCGAWLYQGSVQGMLLFGLTLSLLAISLLAVQGGLRLIGNLLWR